MGILIMGGYIWGLANPTYEDAKNVCKMDVIYIPLY